MSTEYRYRTQGPSSWVSMSSSLTTPSTCFTPRYFSSSSASYRTPYSRYDRSYSTPVRYSESPSYYYNRCISETYIPNNRYEIDKEVSSSRTYENIDRYKYGDNHESQNENNSYFFRTCPDINSRYREQSSNNHSYSRGNNYVTDGNILDKFCEKKKTNDNPTNTDSYKHIRKSTITNNRSCNPLYSDHVARFYQRITDIFEKDETQSIDDDKISKRFSHNDDIRKPRPSYRTVLEDVKDLEIKYKKINEEAEKKRTKTELDYLRPNNYLQSRHHWETNEEDHRISVENVPVDKYHRKHLKYYHDIAVNINSQGRSARYEIPHSRTARNQTFERTNNSSECSEFLRRFDVMKDDGTIPTKKVERKETENLQTICQSLSTSGSGGRPWEERGGLAIDCGLRRRYTNRENRLARQMLDHIRTQTKWTSGVDRPFVLGI